MNTKLLLALGFAVALSGCGGGEDAEPAVGIDCKAAVRSVQAAPTSYQNTTAIVSAEFYVAGGGSSVLLTASAIAKLPGTTTGGRYVDGALVLFVDGSEAAAMPYTLGNASTLDEVRSYRADLNLSGLATGKHTASLYSRLDASAGADGANIYGAQVFAQVCD